MAVGEKIASRVTVAAISSARWWPNNMSRQISGKAWRRHQKAPLQIIARRATLATKIDVGIFPADDRHLTPGRRYRERPVFVPKWRKWHLSAASAVFEKAGAYAAAHVNVVPGDALGLKSSRDTAFAAATCGGMAVIDGDADGSQSCVK